VPTGVAQELVSLGYDEVFRVGGADRYDTAAQVAAALGTGSGTTATGCLDPDTTDGSARMGWYGNDVAEFRTDATTCELLPHAVVLADGGTGADALAAGWWTSFWQVPILLTAPDGSLPAATSNALSALQPSAIIVLGGTGRIPETTVDQAKSLAGGAAAGRVDGNDRYATSVAMAEYFGGWWPTGNAADFAGSMVCVAASGPTTGWPDALAAGPWCAAASGAASDPGAPALLLAPAEGSAPTTTRGGVRPAHDAVPVLTVPPSSGATSEADDFLASVFDSSQSWCDSASAAPCEPPGFVVAFGGAGSVSQPALVQLATEASGGRYGALTRTDLAPSLSGPFGTDLDLGPIFSTSSPGSTQLCLARGSITGVRWLTAVGADGAPLTSDMVSTSVYARATDPAPGSRPFCWPAAGVVLPANLVGTSLSGHVASFRMPSGGRLRMTGPVDMGAPRSEAGPPSSQGTAGGGTTDYVFSAGGGGVIVSIKGLAGAVGGVTMALHLVRGGTNPSGALLPDMVLGTVALATDIGIVTGSIAAEAEMAGAQWDIRGRIDWSGTATMGSGSGGFSGTLTVGTSGADGDNLVWTADGFVG